MKEVTKGEAGWRSRTLGLSRAQLDREVIVVGYLDYSGWTCLSTPTFRPRGEGDSPCADGYEWDWQAELTGIGPVVHNGS